MWILGDSVLSKKRTKSISSKIKPFLAILSLIKRFNLIFDKYINPRKRCSQSLKCIPFVLLTIVRSLVEVIQAVNSVGCSIT